MVDVPKEQQLRDWMVKGSRLSAKLSDICRIDRAAATGGLAAASRQLAHIPGSATHPPPAGCPPKPGSLPIPQGLGTCAA